MNESKSDYLEMIFIENEIEKDESSIKSDFDDMKIKYIHKIINDILIKNYMYLDNDQYENMRLKIEKMIS